MALSSEVVAEIKSLHNKALAEGSLLPWPKIQQYSALFRERFGPEALKRLDGEAFLSTMHDHGNRESLVYWLEFKNDEEFPDIFGGIGGSALKIRGAVYLGFARLADTGSAGLIGALEEAVSTISANTSSAPA